jgi:Circularly permutated YpsA SLOG family
MGGSKKTAELAARRWKPWHLHSSIYQRERHLLDFIARNQSHTLNVAGSSASKKPEIYAFVKGMLQAALFPRPNSWIGDHGEG